jgi:uncharacterized C2H2 Zn-finger protein
MARARRKSTATSSEGDSGGQFKCPECGKTFGRAASLGAHRNRAHGVAGASKNATRSQRPSRSAAKGRRGRPAGATTTPRSSQRRQSALDRNKLLETLFPNGVPPREDVVRRVGSWLDEAERLTQL